MHTLYIAQNAMSSISGVRTVHLCRREAFYLFSGKIGCFFFPLGERFVVLFQNC